MGDVVVGEGAFTIRRVAKIMQQSPSFSVLIENWKQFGRQIGVRETELLDLQRRVEVEIMQVGEIHIHLLSVWKANKGSRATLGELLDALTESGAKDVAEYLEKKLTSAESL